MVLRAQRSLLNVPNPVGNSHNVFLIEVVTILSGMFTISFSSMSITREAIEAIVSSGPNEEQPGVVSMSADSFVYRS